MPIKFRCAHCNQFLGISRARSGGIVDCPSCGRSIRVPNLDGTVAPLPRPSLNLSDSSLASALEQLATLDAAEVSAPSAERSPPAAVQSAIATAPPVIALPVAPVVASPSDAMVDPEDAAPPWLEVEEQVARLARAAPLPAPPTPPSARVTRRDLIAAGLSAAAVGPLTWWLTRRNLAPAPAAIANNAELAIPAPAPAPAAAAEPQLAAVPALTGRITYVTADGESRADAGARVLLFPENRQGSTLLSVDGFRASAAAADLQLARESMKLYGGAFVTADDHGRYDAALASSGTYQMLIISNYQSRPAGPPPPDLLKALGRYFDRPQQLIGQTAYEFAHFRFTGREPAVRDHVFQRS